MGGDGRSTVVAKQRRRRGTLTPAIIRAAAVEVVDEVGVDSITMPLVADRLGAGTTAMAWHFRSKQDLVDAVAADVIAALATELPLIGPGPWDEEIPPHLHLFRANHEGGRPLPSRHELASQIEMGSRKEWWYDR